MSDLKAKLDAVQAEYAKACKPHVDRFNAAVAEADAALSDLRALGVSVSFSHGMMAPKPKIAAKLRIVPPGLEVLS